MIGGYRLIRGAFDGDMIGRVLHTLENADQPIDLNGEQFPIQVRGHPAVIFLAFALMRSGLLDQIMLGPKCMSYPPTIRLQRAGVIETLVPPHQDAGYITHLAEFFTVWIPLTPIREECGGIALYPSLFDGTLRPTSRDGTWLTALDTGDAPQLTFEMNPGDMLCFDKFMIHASLPNSSDRPRISVDMRIFPAGTPCRKPYMDLQTGEIRKDAVR